MLYLNLNPIFQTRNIPNPFRFLVKAGISPSVAHKISRGETRVVRIDHIEAICSALNCTPNDIFSWKPDSKHALPDSHPLHKLKHNPDAPNLGDAIRTLPLEKLNELARILSKDQTPLPPSPQ